MPRPATGSVLEHRTRSGVVSYAIRYRVPGVGRVHEVVGHSPAMTRRKAEEALADRLADVRAGRWRSREEVEAERRAEQVPTLHEFASEWYARREQDGLRPRTLEHLRWTLVDHVLPYFAAERDLRIDQVTVAEVDRYVSHKLAEGRLSKGSIRRTLETLSTVMALAVEHGHIASNPVTGPLRRLKPDKRQPRAFLEPPQVAALLDAASALDAEDRSGRRYRRPLLAVLAFAGLRVGELLALQWRDVDLGAGRIRVRASKTDAGVRTVDVQPELHEDLALWRASTRHAAPTDLVFGTATGAADDRNNVRRRVLLRAVARANERIAQEGGEPLPDGLSPHALRRSFASWLVGEGEDPAYLMEQLGHRDPAMTLGLYARALQSKRRRPHARRTSASNGHPMGSPAAEYAPETAAESAN